MFGKSKDLSNQILICQKLIDAEIKSELRKEQGNFDSGVRNIANYIQQQKKDLSIDHAKKMIISKRKVDALQLVLSASASLKNNVQSINKGEATPELEQILLTLCCCADAFKTNSLVKFKTTIVNVAYKTNAANFSNPEKLNEPLKSLLKPIQPNDSDAISFIRSDVTKYCRSPSLIDSLFGQQQQTQQIQQNQQNQQQNQPSQQQPQPHIPHNTSQARPAPKSEGVSLKFSLSRTSSKVQYKEHSDLYVIINNEPFSRDKWPELLKDIKNANK